MPSTGYARETLVAAGLGEKKIVVQDIESGWEEFRSLIIDEFPKLGNCGGFEFMRCIPNTKDLEAISVGIAQSPKLLKSVVGSGRVFVRPIQLDLELDDDYSKSQTVRNHCMFLLTGVRCIPHSIDQREVHTLRERSADERIAQPCRDMQV